MNIKNILPLIILIIVWLFPQNLSAETAEDFFNQSTWDVCLRAYDFDRDYGNKNLLDQRAFSLGGAFNFLSGPVYWRGLQVGATFYTAQSLGLNSGNVHQVDNTLPGYNLSALGQAFIEYQTKKYLIRAGDQLVNTPWMNASDSRMIPATYQGIYGALNFGEDWVLTAMRMIAFKSRTSSTFTKTNLYNPENIGGSSVSALGTTQDNGALAFAAHYQHNNFAAQVWFYRFYDFSNLLYGDTRYDWNSGKFNPYMGWQFLKEGGDGQNFLSNETGGDANAEAIGLLIGAQVKQINFSVAYNAIPSHDHSFRQGNILSPYTSGYATDPLYTTSMIAGLVEKASGQAIKLNSTYTTDNKAWQISGSFAQYFTAPRFANTNETDLDITYHFSKKLNGFSIRNRLGFLKGNSTTGTFIYNRVMLQYNF